VVTRVAVIAALAFGAGCYAPTFKDCELACAAGSTCPDGFECQGVVCRPIGATLACPTPRPDAPDDGSMMIDAAFVGHPSSPWTSLREVLILPNGCDDPSLTEDRLEMFIGLGGSIAVARFTNDTWGMVAAADNLNFGAGVIDDTPYVSADGLTMHWTSSRVGQGDFDIWRATRPNRNLPWTVQENVQPLNTSSHDAGGSISGDGLMIVFGSNRGGAAAGVDLYSATRSNPTAPWGSVNRITELNTATDEGHPLLSPDKLTIYFHSNRMLASDIDLYEAHRASAAVPFGLPRRLVELASAGGSYDGDPWVSADGRHMFFARTDGSGFKSIWEASR
jgi:Tol biopolymer transport system component